MYIDDHKYQKHCLEMSRSRGHPSGDDWKKVKGFTKFLDIFYQITLNFWGTFYVTSNFFFHELFNLSFITKNSHGDDVVLIDMADKMQVKFDKYWGDFDNMNILIFVVVVLDPRYKMRYVKFIFVNSYGILVGNLRSEKVMNTLTRLFNHFKDSSSRTSAENLGGQFNMLTESDSGEICKSQWEKYLQEEDNVGNMNDLERYLIDDMEFTKDLNIVAWWKDASKRYPIVSRIAKDVLTVPISTIAFESSFRNGGWILDSYQSS
ncbi:zinc finger BED domain-containing protein RICESLEEPER 4-like [Lycium barbarum]|uniref:zinc finger BED domain-containing protein RICESLEEPER 4-like n=1 Tax=Lycium barbarum TaxID=112863 RepID=UPI00293F6D23|nr:zinc finger BED domain-containing protein RICESLEEPER 4-like [Lycium barbarum]